MVRGGIHNSKGIDYLVCALAALATLFYINFAVGEVVEVQELFLYAWPLVPYALIAVLLRAAPQSKYWLSILRLTLFVCLIVAVVRYAMFWNAAAHDPGYEQTIRRIGFFRVPLEQLACMSPILFVAWIGSLFRSK